MAPIHIVSLLSFLLFVLNAFYKQHSVSHYSRPVLGDVLFYVFHRKKTDKIYNNCDIMDRIWSSSEWIISLLVFLINLPFWQSEILVPGLEYERQSFWLIPKLVFHSHHLQSISRARPFSHVFTLSCSFQTSSEPQVHFSRLSVLELTFIILKVEIHISHAVSFCFLWYTFVITCHWFFWILAK